MAGQDDQPRPAPSAGRKTATVEELGDAIDAGRTGEKVSFPDPVASPLGTDDEAAGRPDALHPATTALREGLEPGKGSRLFGLEETRLCPVRPLSPNIQIYQPQLTSVLSIVNRITGVLASLAAIGLVAWLLAAAAGPQAYAARHHANSSWIGQVVLVCFTFAFFLHFCGGIRHLVWDTVHAFELRSIYIGGWMVVAASLLLTAGTWIASSFMAG